MHNPNPTWPLAPRPPRASARGGRAATLFIALVGLPCLTGCAEGAEQPLSWSIAFECDYDRARAEHVNLGIAPGGCPLTSRALYEVTVPLKTEGPAIAPGELQPGAYAIFGTATDADGGELANGCVAVRLPRTEPIQLVLSSRDGCSTDAGSKLGADYDGGTPSTTPDPTGTPGVDDQDAGTAMDPLEALPHAPFGELTGACESDADCMEGSCCTSNNCGGGMCTYACTMDSDCPGGMLCEHETCFLACSSDDECPGSWSCEHDGTICEAE